MLNPQTEIKFSDYNSLYDILNPTVNGFRDFSLSFLIDYKAGASLFSGTNYSLYSEGLHKGTLLGCTVDNPGGSGFIGAGVMGKSMIRNLMKKGFQVKVYSRTK